MSGAHGVARHVTRPYLMACISLHFQRMTAVSLDVFCSRQMTCATRQVTSVQRDVT